MTTIVDTVGAIIGIIIVGAFAIVQFIHLVTLPLSKDETRRIIREELERFKEDNP